jgi:hypothetical protein
MRVSPRNPFYGMSEEGLARLCGWYSQRIRDRRPLVQPGEAGGISGRSRLLADNTRTPIDELYSIALSQGGHVTGLKQKKDGEILAHRITLPARTSYVR